MTATLTAPITFTVPGAAVPQPRHKVSTFGGHARAYLPSDHPVHAFKASIRMALAEAYDGGPLEGPLAVSAVFILLRPASMFKKRGGNPRRWHTGARADADNLGKALLDALTDGGLWRDDAQVARLRIDKHVAAGDEHPRTEVRIEPLEGGS